MKEASPLNEKDRQDMGVQAAAARRVSTDQAVGKALWALRNARGQTLEALARVVGTTPDRLAQIEAGEVRATPEILLTSAEHFQVPVSRLFDLAARRH